jgi:tetratricopeptide (TPR) repeat protein
MPRVFLSHVRADRAHARRLAEVLRHAGYMPWLVEDEARVGEPLAETLARGLRDTRQAVVLLSRTSVESAWTSTEVQLLRGSAQAPLRLHLARLDRVEPPVELSGERAIDLFPGETAWQSGVKRLLHLLGETGTALPGDTPSSLPPHNLPPRAEPFVGREQELSALHEQLLTGSAKGGVLLTGPRGIGKTSLAVEYALRYAADYPGGLWWVPARLGPRRALAWFFKDLPPSHLHSFEGRLLYADTLTEDLARGVVHSLQSHPKPSLLILDDLKGAGWRQFLPSGQVRVLATSRSAAFVRPLFPHVQRLHALSDEDLNALFAEVFCRAGMPPQPAARGGMLAPHLRASPFLAVLVARFQARTQASWSDIEAAVRQRLPSETWSGTREGKASLEQAVVELCIERFPTHFLARHLLEVAALFAPDVELDARLCWDAVSGQALFEDVPTEALHALKAVGDSGLTQLWESDVPLLRVPGRVLQRLRALAPMSTRGPTARRTLASTLEWARAASDYEDFDFERLRPHLEAVLRATAELTDSRDWVELADVLASFLALHGEHLEAKALWKHALHRAQREPGYEPERLGELRARLASSQKALGNSSAARRLLLQVVADDAATPRGDAAKKAQRLADLALLQLETHEPLAALESIDRALELDREALGDDVPPPPLQLFLRARILRALGNHDEAHEVLEEALTAGERLSDAHHFALMPLLEALSESRRARHDEKGALALLERASEMDRLFLGDDHYDTVRHLTELARTHAEFERRPQTRAAVERVLPLLDKALPPTDPRRSELLLRLAESLERVGEREEAHRLLSRALDVEAAQATPDLERLSRLVITASGPDTDVPLFERALSLLQRSAPRRPSASKSLMKFITRILDTTEVEAPPTAPSPLQTVSPGAGAESLERALRLSRRKQLADTVKAEALREALAAAEQGNDPANGARACFLLADLEGRRGAWEQARAHARQGLPLALRADLPALVAEGYRVLGDTALHGSFYEEARMSYEEAIRRHDQLGDVARAARARTLLVTLLMQLGHHQGREEHLRWLDAHRLHPDLTEEDREDLQAVLALAASGLSSPTPDARHPKP